MDKCIYAMEIKLRVPVALYTYILLQILDMLDP